MFRALILSLFAYGQIGSITHAHEHSDETQHSVCEFCILTINEDKGSSDSSDLPDVSDGPSFLNTPEQPNIHLIEVRVIQSVSLCKEPTLASFCRFLDGARAPPFKNEIIVEQI